MTFEAILNEVGGGFGPYQKFLTVVFLIPCSIVIPWFSSATIFLSSTPDHWCHVPELVDSNLTIDLQRKLIGPPNSPKCFMHDIDYSLIIESKNYSVDPEWPVKKCDNGWDFDKTYYDATLVTKWELVCGNDYYSSLVVSLMFVGMTLGTPFFGLMSDRVGRKPTFLTAVFLIAISDIGSTFCPVFGIYLALRMVNGACILSVYSLAFLMVLELVSPDVRSLVNGISTVAWVVGLCLIPMVAWLTRNWVYLSLTTTTAATCLLLYWKIVPESPAWLISQGRYQDAHDVLTELRKWSSKENSNSKQLLDSIQNFGDSLKEQTQAAEKASPLDFITHPRLRLRCILLNISWISAFMSYYGQQVNIRNLAGNEFLNFFYLSAVELPASLFAWAAMELVGRRWCAGLSFAVSSVTCLVPAVIPTEYLVTRTVSVTVAKAGSSAAFMTVYIMTSELLPTTLRSFGMGLCSTLASGSTFMAPYIVYLGKYGSRIPFMCFSAISLLGVVSSLFLTETLNKELPHTVRDLDRQSEDKTVIKSKSQRSKTKSSRDPVLVQYIQRRFSDAMDSTKAVYYTKEALYL